MNFVGELSFHFGTVTTQLQGRIDLSSVLKRGLFYVLDTCLKSDLAEIIDEIISYDL